VPPLPAAPLSASPKSGRGGVASLVLALRPRQWLKNALLFAGLLFTLDQRHPLADYGRACAGFVVFSLLSGCAYLLNDIQDAAADRLHPRKRHRPIAAGHLSIGVARAFTAVAVPLALFGAWRVTPGLCALGFLYFVVTLAYSLHLKNVVVIDVMVVAAGFVIRAVAGAVAVGVDASVWLLLCTGLLALFLALNKRRGELVALGDAPPTRPILAEYSVPMLEQMITIVAAACIMAYSLYTFFSETGRHRPYLMATIPFVIYGIFRYLYLAYRHNQGEAPEMVLAEDLPLRLNLVLWALTAAAALLSRH
jgi:4-hydroxybenzoate polyprenyltransferase